MSTTENQELDKAIEWLEQTIRDIRTGVIDGYILISTQGRHVRHCRRIGVKIAALGPLSLQLQKVNSECLEAWSKFEQYDVESRPTLSVVEDEGGNFE